MTRSRFESTSRPSANRGLKLSTIKGALHSDSLFAAARIHRGLRRSQSVPRQRLPYERGIPISTVTVEDTEYDFRQPRRIDSTTLVG
jgi:hypothetical protein